MSHETVPSNQPAGRASFVCIGHRALLRCYVGCRASDRQALKVPEKSDLSGIQCVCQKKYGTFLDFETCLVSCGIHHRPIGD